MRSCWTLAAAGRLREPEVLSAEVHRMLADDRSDALVENFTGQWLQLRNLEAKVVPDILMFPDFDDNIRKGFRNETEMFFGYILRENRSALELLNADYTFVDERLARHYGIQGVYGPQFRRVKLTDPNRRGLLGQGSILAMTSVATRTSPVYRGKYVLSTFLNTPPPPPPPNVPTLDESNKESKTPKTVRAQLELHRKNQPCAGCHRVIDPPGFALENFDSVGVWRDKGADGAPLDVAGTLADGHAGQRSGGAAGGHSEPSRRFRDRGHRKDADLRAGPRAGAGRHAGGSPDREEGRAEQLPAFLHRHGHCRERAVPDAHQTRTG